MLDQKLSQLSDLPLPIQDLDLFYTVRTASTSTNTATGSFKVTWIEIKDEAIDDTAVTPGSYGNSTHVGAFTVNQQGQLTAASNVAISGGGGGGNWTLIETLTIGSAVQDTAFAATLDGDADEIYEIQGYLISGNNGADQDLSLRPNNVSTNQTGFVTPSVGARSDLFLAAAANGNTTKVAGFVAQLWAKTGGLRICKSDSTSTGTPQVSNNSLAGNGAWLDIATNITSLHIHSSISSGIGVGSVFRLYKLTS